MARGELRNPLLYTSLMDHYGDVSVVNLGNPGSYSYPSLKKSGMRRGGRVPMGRVHEWGEIYAVRCKVCGDHKPRLYVSHYTGTKAYTKTVVNKVKGTSKPGSPVIFGIVAVCHNERCNVTRDISKVLDATGELTDVITHAPMKYTGGMVESVELPANYSLFDPKVPEEVLSYVSNRGYDIDYLQNQFDVRYMPPGTYMWTRDDDSKVESWDHRLLIPITRARRIIGWQARIAQDVVKSPGNKIRKYIFPPTGVTGGEGKSCWLYNSYKASYNTELTIVEGVTDAWRVGGATVAAFGKSLSERQIQILKDGWGHFASCVIAFDGDSDAWKAACKVRDRLLEEGVFRKGVTALRLAEGMDPDNYSTEQINSLIKQARSRCQPL